MAGAEPKANPGKGRAEPSAITHQEEVASGAEPNANPGKGRVEPGAIAQREEVAAGAEPKTNPRKGRAEPDAIAHQEEVAAGAEPKANPEKGQAEPDAIAHQEPKRVQQRAEDHRHWLEGLADHLKEGEVVAKRKALARDVPPHVDGYSFEEVARVGINFGGMMRQGRGRRRKPVSADSTSTGI